MSCTASAVTASTGTTSCAAFGEHFTAAAWDARGYGDSDDYDGPLAFADFSADLARVLDGFGAERAHLVGLSLGGRIARDFALRHPTRVATLVLANTTAGFDTLTPDQVEAFIRSRRGPLDAGRTPRELAPELAQNLIGPSARGGRARTAARLDGDAAQGFVPEDDRGLDARGPRRAHRGDRAPRSW